MACDRCRVMKLAAWLRDWWSELLDRATYQSRSRATEAAFAVCIALSATTLLLGAAQACGSAGATVTKIGHLLRAASALHELAEDVAEIEGTPEAGELLDKQLPQALEKLELALSELCADGGP